MNSLYAREMKREKIIHPEHRVVEMVVTGHLDLKRIAEWGKECRLFALKRNFGFLLDVRDVTGFPTIEEGSQWFDRYYTGLELSLKSVYTAHIASDDHFEVMQGIDKNWNAQGAYGSTFKDRSHAISWLQGSLA